MIKNYIIDSIQKKEKLKALFFNEIDNTVRKPQERFVNSGESKDVVKVVSGDVVTYDYNSLGFRSEEFTKKHNGEHVLFAGCSETEGVGGNIDACWSYMVYSELSKNNRLSGFFNLSRYGWGYDIIIQNIMCYINDYGKPKKIFILFPNIGRFYNWIDRDVDGFESFEYKGHIPNRAGDLSSSPSWKRKMTLAEHRSHFIIFTMIIKLFEEYCISNNIELYWSTWDLEDQENYQKIDVFKSFMPILDLNIFIKNNIDLFLTEIETRPDWEEKRDGHHGYVFHYNWARSFLDSVNNKK